MSRSPTDTLILTGLDDALLNDPKPIIQYLSHLKLEIEFISLPKFGRILLLCRSKDDAETIYQSLKNSEWSSQFNLSYSIKDNDTLIRSQATTDELVDYLELPLEHGSKRFLISPPLSPPPEWDHWHKAEEGPSKQTLHSAKELSHLLWERLGHQDESGDTVRKYEYNDPDDSCKSLPGQLHNLKEEPEVLFRDIENGVPAIIVDSVRRPDDIDAKPKKITQKTAMPPPLEY